MLYLLLNKIIMKNKIENTSTPSNDTIHNVRVSTLKITDFVDGFKFRYRGKPCVWNNEALCDPIEYNISLVESELDLGYITPY